MRFTKPSWVSHQVDKKRVCIFSVHVHPDGTRVATGGLDAKIRIWSTLPILQPEYDDADERATDKTACPPKSLCTLSMHTGPVLCVRWAHSGKWLASGSDDAVVMIWDLDPYGSGKVWGSDETNIEGWKALKRLPGHDSDVTDLAFSPDDRYLASVGLDSKVIIWSGVTLEMLRKLDLHQGFVKGVCWDPVGQFLATQSDDKSVKIWRTSDWSLEASITEPFENSPGSTFFRRLSWSPDGAHITASNAMNNNGYVFVAAVISRSSWTSTISLVGHENTVEVSAYNPHIFLRRPEDPVVTTNVCSVVALGSDDLTVSIWQTKSARPLVAAKDVFERPVMDLCWSLNGLTLYACSSDGTIGVFDFDEKELQGIVPLSANEPYLQLFNFTPPPISESYAPQPQQPIMRAPTISARTPPPSPPSNLAANAESSVVNVNGKQKRRIKPVFVSHLSSAPSLNGLSQGSGAGPRGDIQFFHASSPAPAPFGLKTESRASASPMPSSSAPVPLASRPQTSSSLASSMALPLRHTEQNLANPFAPPLQSQTTPLAGPASSRPPYEDIDMDANMDVPIDSWAGTNDSKRNGKQKALDSGEDDSASKAGKARTLGGDRPRESLGPVKEIRSISFPMDLDMPNNRSGALAGPSTTGVMRLGAPVLRTRLSARVEDKDSDVFEGTNSEDRSAPSEVTFISGKQVQFLDFVSSGILLLVATSVFCAAALEDGSINVYSPTGRRLMPSMLLDSPCVALEGNKCYLMAITLTARIYIWNIKTQRAHFPPTDIQPLLSTPSASILTTQVRPNGSPVIVLSTGVAYSFDPSLSTWLRISEARWSQGSAVWEGKQRASANRTLASKGIISALEGAISDLDISELSPNAGQSQASSTLQWWNTAMTLGHLETRLHAARLLDSPSEYKTALILYAKRIAEEGFRAKAEELMKELCGPLYWRPSREDTWCPTVLGMSKRELLKDVMSIFARSKSLAKLGHDWQDMIKRAQAEE